MPDMDKFIQEMSEHKGEMQAGIANICKEIKQMRAERQKHSDEFWDKINNMNMAIHNEETSRIDGDNVLDGKLKIIVARGKGIAAGVAMLAVILGLVVRFL